MFTSVFLKCATLGIEIPSNFSGPFIFGVAFGQGESGSFLGDVEHVLWRTIPVNSALRKGQRFGVGVVDGRDFGMEINCQWKDGILPFVDFAQVTNSLMEEKENANKRGDRSVEEIHHDHRVIDEGLGLDIHG